MDTVAFPLPFQPGFMGHETEQDFMRDFTACMRDSGIKSYPATYAELVAKANRSIGKIEPKSFVPTVIKPSEGGNRNGATYDGPADLDYSGKKFGKVPGTRSGRGFVHAMSDAQKKYVLFLLNTKDTTELSTKLVKGWTLNPSEIDSISKQHARPFIDALKACPEKPKTITPYSDKTTLIGSDKQINWITNSLLSQKGILSESDIKELYTRCNYQARNVISELLAMPTVKNPKETKAKSEEITEGMYTDGTRIIRAYSNREKTRILAKELIQEDDDYSFSYLGKAERFVKDMRKMTLDEAKAFGRMTETCCVCGTHLSDPDSQKKGIGPWCEKQF